MPDLFDLLARWYDRIFGFRDAAPLLRLLGLEPGQRLLDLGGGTGRVSQDLVGLRLVVCDPSAGMARQARRKGLTTCRGRAETLPFGQGVFDAVLVVDAFHHFDDQHKAVPEMLRVLRPGGRLLLEEPDIRHPAIRLVAWGERLLGLSSRILPLPELRARFEAAGATVEASEEGALFVRLVAIPPKEGP